MTCVAPPNSAVWYSLADTTAAVLATLRLTDGDVDADRIEAQVPAAATLIDQYLDRVEAIPGPPPAPHIQQALEQLVVELYRRKEPNAAAARVLDPVRSELTPHKRRWGVG
jgi:hypothetical protein